MKKVFILFVLFLAALAVAVGLSFNETRKAPNTAPAGTGPTGGEISSASSSTAATAIESDTGAVTAETLLLEVTSPASGTVSGSSVAVTGKTVPGANVIVNEYEMKADATGVFSRTVSLDEGENYISIVAYTDTGEVAETELMIVRE